MFSFFIQNCAALNKKSSSSQLSLNREKTGGSTSNPEEEMAKSIVSINKFLFYYMHSNVFIFGSESGCVKQEVIIKSVIIES